MPARRKPVLAYPIRDKQVALDQVYHHFLVEGAPPGYDAAHGGCVYDTPRGGCAIGCLAPRAYRRRIAGFFWPVAWLAEHDAAEFARHFAAPLVAFLTELQDAHDLACGLGVATRRVEPRAFAAAFDQRLRRLVVAHGLAWPGGE